VPDWKPEIRRRLEGLRLAPTRESEIVEELSQHLDDRYEELVASGATKEQADRQTLAELSERELLARELRRVEQQINPEPIIFGTNRRTNMIADLWQDLRYGARMLLKNPGFTLIIVFILALGIGANTAIFSLIDAVLLKMLPVKDPEQLVLLDSTPSIGFSYPMFQDLQDRSEVFTEVFAYSGQALNLSESDQTERVSGQLVSGNFFSGLGVRPLIGRVFSAEDDKVPGEHPVAVLGYHFWQRRFASDPNVVGKTIHLNGYPFTVIGISPPGFFGVEVGSAPEVWVPRMMQPQLSAGDNRLRMLNRFGVRIMARLKPGVSEQQAQVATDILAQQINSEAPAGKLRDFLLGLHIEVHPASKGLSRLRSQFKQPLLILMGMVGLVLLIACTNVANLLLARAAARQKEIAVRLALGASRFRLARQLLTESLLLSFCGALFGLLLAFWATDLLVNLVVRSQFSLEIHPDFRVLAFTLCLAVLTGILFGLATAIQATRADLTSALNNESSTLATGGSRFELRKILVVAQVAISMLLLVGAGLFVRTLQNLKGIDLGFRADKVLLLSVNPSLNGYSPDQVRNFDAQLLERVGTLPGVQSASLADMPLLGGVWIDGLSVEGYQAPAGQDMSMRGKKVGPKFFETMGITLLMGRDFNTQDGPAAGKVAIINETLAHEFFGQANPLGRRIGVGSKEPDREIIGVIKDTKYGGLKEPVPHTVYVPLAQAEGKSAERTLHVRTAGEPKNLIAALRHEVQSLDKNLPVYEVRTFTELVAESLSQERIIATLSGCFGLIALLLAAVGLYGVMAYTVVSRTREMGVRLALGAQTGDLLRLVVVQGMRLALFGIIIGLAGAFAATRLLRGLLFGVGTIDPLTFISIALLLVLVALLACYLPARRATKVDPMVALRGE
jgi:predicted permease